MTGDAASSEVEWVPAFPGQRPPFPVHHGAYSPRKVDPLAAELVERVLADDAAAYLRAPMWRPALWAWGRAEAQVQLLTEYLARAGEEAGDGVGDLDLDHVRAAYLLLHRAEARATTQRTRLGLDPLSAARLGRDKTAAAVDTARVMAHLERAERERDRDRRRRDSEDDDGAETP